MLFDILADNVYKSKSLRVYRWQHKYSGFGPLCARNDDPFYWFNVFHEHQGPSDDDAFKEFTKSQYSNDDHFYAWDSLDKFIDVLMEGAETTLEDAGYLLTEWEVTEDFCVLADGQVYFNRSKATRIN